MASHEQSNEPTGTHVIDNCLEILCSFGFKPVSNGGDHIELHGRHGHLFLVREEDSYRCSLIESPKNKKY